jgi:hypothetical protein
MNLKFSQFPRLNNFTNNDIIPVLRNNNNYAISGLAIYNYLSGDFFKDLYTSYTSYSSLFVTNGVTISSMFSTFSQNSARYVTTNTAQTISGIKTFLNSTNFTSSLSAFIIYTPNGNSSQWSQASTYINANSSRFISTFNTLSTLSSTWVDTSNIVADVSGKLVLSDTTFYPTATSIKNIIAIEQVVYDNLLILDPYTLYIVV